MKKIILFVIGLVITSLFTACDLSKTSPEKEACKVRCYELSQEETECFAISNIRVVVRNLPTLHRKSRVILENGETFWKSGRVLADSCKKIPCYYPRKVIDGDSVCYIPEFVGYRYEIIH